MRAAATIATAGAVHTLTIGAANKLCFPVTVSAATITYGGQGQPWSHKGYATYSVGRYDGVKALVFKMPRISSPCSGIAVYVGTALAEKDVDPPGPAGVVTGFTVPAGGETSFSQVIAVDVLGGPGCAAAGG